MGLAAASTLACAIVVATAATAPASGVDVKVGYIEGTSTVPASGSDGLDGRCPKATPRAIAGYFLPKDQAQFGKLALTESSFLDARSWEVAAKNLGTDSVDWFAGTVCVKWAGIQIREDAGVADPGKDAGFKETCKGRAPQPLGGYFGPKDKSGIGQIVLDNSFPVGSHAWDVGVRNLSDQPQAFYIGVLCAPARPQLVHKVRAGTVNPGAESGFKLTCPRNAPRRLGGYFGPQSPTAVGQIALADTYPSGPPRTSRTWDVGVANLSDQPQAFFAGAVCSP